MSDSSAPTIINFHYLKSGEYRNYHADGVAGGRTPSGDIFITFYVERGAIPQLEQYELKPDGRLGELLNSEGKKGIIRDIECGVVLTSKGAEALRDWLTKIIEGQDK